MVLRLKNYQDLARSDYDSDLQGVANVLKANRTLQIEKYKW